MMIRLGSKRSVLSFLSARLGGRFGYNCWQPSAWSPVKCACMFGAHTYTYMLCSYCPCSFSVLCVKFLSQGAESHSHLFKRNKHWMISVFMHFESTCHGALTGFKELETLYPNCESVTRAWQESGGPYRTAETRERERIHHVYQQRKAKLRCERKDSLCLSILVHLRKRLHKNNVDVCQILPWFSADCCGKAGVKVSGSVEWCQEKMESVNV